MRKHLLALVVILAAGGLSPAAATRKKPRANPAVQALMTWFEHLREGLSVSSVGRNYERRDDLAAVAAVRGNEQDLADLNRPAWEKTNVSKKTELLKERKELSKAIDAILSGKVKEGSSALDAFEKAHPKSPLSNEVLRTRKKLAELAALEKKSAKSGSQEP